MKVALALRTHHHGGTIDACLSFHLNLGVELVLVSDHGSTDGTLEVLRAYADEGAVSLLEPGMSRAGVGAAAAEAGAGWVLHAGGDEFLWPRGPGLSEVLADIPPRYKVVRGLERGASDRPVARVVAHQALGARSLDPDGEIGSELVPLRGWYPIEVLRAGSELAGDARLEEALHRLRLPVPSGGRAYALPSELARPLELPVPSVVDDAAYAVEVAEVGETDIDDVRERLDRLESELARLAGAQNASRRRIRGLRRRPDW